jgi:AcrR family transcriptional regulator
MPTPDRTSLDDIVQAGRDILESEGLTGLTMQAVADRVGVRAPSLYKRVRSRSDLLGLIAEATVRELGDLLEAVATSGNPHHAEPRPTGPHVTARPRTDAHATDARRNIVELARAFRAFAHAHPAGFHLIFAPGSDVTHPDLGLLAQASSPVIRLAAELAGPENALDAARTLTAWASGFVSMELAGAFKLGGDIDRAYEFGSARLADALAITPAPRPA